MISFRARHAWFDRTAPPERLAAYRIVLGVFVTAYLIGRTEAFLELGTRDANRFDPVGVFRLIGQPISGATNSVIVAAVIAGGVAFTVGWRFRLTGPLFAVGVMLLTTHRSSWGQMLHFENLMTLQLIVLAPFRAADAWSLDRRRTTSTAPRGASVDYQFPLTVASVVVVTTYVIAGIAKLRNGGLDWVVGDTLRNHIAYSYSRLDLFGANGSVFARLALDYERVLPFLAGTSVLVELLAPVALLGGLWRNVWVAAAWFMHVGILALMLVGFPSPLFLVAFAPMFRLERCTIAWKQAKHRFPSRDIRSCPSELESSDRSH
jgi:hypothetical protein